MNEGMAHTAKVQGNGLGVDEGHWIIDLHSGGGGRNKRMFMVWTGEPLSGQERIWSEKIISWVNQ